MKKFLSILILVVVLCCSLVSCGAAGSGSIKDVAECVDSKYMDLAVVEYDFHDGWTILYDKNTMVMYIILDAYQSTGMTPILNADGTPRLYEGD
jgi:hypothetical protein